MVDRSALPLVPKISKKVSIPHFIHKTSKLTVYSIITICLILFSGLVI